MLETSFRPRSTRGLHESQAPLEKSGRRNEAGYKRFAGLHKWLLKAQVSRESIPDSVASSRVQGLIGLGRCASSVLGVLGPVAVWALGNRSSRAAGSTRRFGRHRISIAGDQPAEKM